MSSGAIYTYRPDFRFRKTAVPKYIYLPNFRIPDDQEDPPWRTAARLSGPGGLIDIDGLTGDYYRFFVDGALDPYEFNSLLWLNPFPTIRPFMPLIEFKDGLEIQLGAKLGTTTRNVHIFWVQYPELR